MISSHLIKLAVTCVLIVSCQAKKKDDPYKSIVTVSFENWRDKRSSLPYQYPKDSITRQIPELYAETVIRNERRKIEYALKIGSLENGFYGQQIRIHGNEYKEYENGWTRLLVLTNTAAWSAEIYYMRVAFEDGFVPRVDSLQYQKYPLGTPRIGWNSFIDSVTHMGLFILPDCDDIAGYLANMSTDEWSYDVEIASDRFYRIYGFFEPMERSTKFPQAKQLMNIITFIKQQFDFPKPLTSPDNKKKNT